MKYSGEDMNLNRFIKNKEKIYKMMDILIPFILGLIYLAWSRRIVIGGGDDEFMRYDIARYIYDHKKLPWVDDTALCSTNIWGLSYANRPMLNYMISAFFMWISSLIGYADEVSLMYAARLTSVISSAVTIYFMIRIADRLGLGNRYFMPVCFGLVPEFAFLSGYVNSDSFAIMSVAMTIYFWIMGLQMKWDKKSIIGITISLAICLASYQNVYGYILLSGTLFLISSLYFSKRGGRPFSRAFLIGIGVIAVVLLLSGWWYIRNAIHYNGDFSGRKAMLEASEMYAVPELKPGNKLSLYEQGVSLFTMLFPMGWLSGGLYSCIGNFRVFEGSEAEVKLFSILIKLMIAVIALGVAAYIAGRIYKFVKKKSGYKSEDISDDFLPGSLRTLADIHLFTGAFIVCLLSLIYSYFDDFQLAGRYIVPALLPVFIWFGQGFEYAGKRIPAVVERVLTILIIILFSSANIMSIS